jgi:hypothetical protein
MKVSDVFASQETLRAADLGDKEWTLAIASVESKNFDDGTKLVIGFQNAKKKLVANKTNSGRIAKLYGDETDGWVGKEVILRAEMVDFKGESVMAIRVQPPKNRTAQQPVQPRPAAPPAQQRVQDVDFNDAIPF